MGRFYFSALPPKSIRRSSLASTREKKPHNVENWETQCSHQNVGSRTLDSGARRDFNAADAQGDFCSGLSPSCFVDSRDRVSVSISFDLFPETT